MAKKPTIKSSLFQPTEPARRKTTTNRIVASIREQLTEPTQTEEPRHHTSTRLPMGVHEYFEELAVEHGYSAHSLRIYAVSWFVKEHRAGNIKLERDRAVKGKRVLKMPDI